jgi:hypothetical protein
MPVNFNKVYISDVYQEPGNLCHLTNNAQVLKALISDNNIKTLAGFASGKTPAGYY